MTIDALGVIYTGANEYYMQELTQSRSIAALPIYARYRLIDFFLSNFVNSDVHNVGVITQKNYRSIMDHISGGREWDLNRKRDGLFILPPYGTAGNPGFYNGTVEALCGIRDYLEKSSQKYVIFSDSTVLYKADFRPMIEYHLSKKADITMMYWHADEEEFQSMHNPVVLDVARGGRIKGVAFNPANPEGPRVATGTFVADKSLIIRLCDAALSMGETRFIEGIIAKNLEGLRIYGYRHNGYVAALHSTRNYFKACMDVLDDKVRAELFLNDQMPVYTKVRDEIPTRYVGEGTAVNSSLADGCIIGGNVENSVLFRGVKIGKNAVVKNCIIFQDCEIMDGCVLENVILDKDVIVRNGKTLMGAASYPVVIAKGSVI